MATNKPKPPKTPKPTLESLLTSGTLSPTECEALESTILRIAQIQEELKTLEAEKGYRDQYTGTRHPGLTDLLERLLILHDLTLTGIRWNNYSIAMVPGSNSRIDPGLLLAEGVPADTIARCTITTSWLSAQVRRDPTPRGGTIDGGGDR